MFNATSDTVIVHVPMDQVCVRINGVDRVGLRPSRGFAMLESSDGVQTPISSPFYGWFIDAVYNSVTPDMNVVFMIEAGTPRGPDLDALVEQDLGV